MIRTRVGYMGGTKIDPTYHDLGDHSETVQVDYDPTVITYEQLLEVFFASHDPTRKGSSCQYKSAIFFHDAEQERLARAVAAALEATLGEPVQTEIVEAASFYRAEDYHQKYALQADGTMMREFREIYPEFKDIVDSTAATRVNAYLYGCGTAEQLERELASLGLSEESQERLLERVE